MKQPELKRKWAGLTATLKLFIRYGTRCCGCSRGTSRRTAAPFVEMSMPSAAARYRRRGRKGDVRMANSNENDLNDLLIDINDPDEDDQEMREERFVYYQEHGKTPEDLPGETPEVRAQYAEWLKSQSE